MTDRLAGKVAIVTGSARGIGAATARLMVAEGAWVVLADLDAGGIHRVAAELGDRAVAQPTDVMLEADVAATVERAVSTLAKAAAAGRVCTPEDIADVVVFLASDEARYVSGQVVSVNGGGTRVMTW